MTSTVEPASTRSRWTLGQRLVLIYALAMGLPAAWAFTVKGFVPTLFGFVVTLSAAAVAAGLAVLYAVADPAFTADTSYFQALRKKYPALGHTWKRAVFFAIAAFLLTDVGMERGVLQWWTWAVGRPGETVLTVERWRSSGRKTCAGYYFRETWFLLEPALCAYAPAGAAREPGARVRISGPVSAVGVDERSFTVEPPGAACP